MKKYMKSLRKISYIGMLLLGLWIYDLSCNATGVTAITDEQVSSETQETIKKEKPGWKKTKAKKKYYVKKDGSRAVGSYKIKGIYYVFNEEGYLLKSKKDNHYMIGQNVYYVGKDGKALSGWHILKGKMYYAGKSGKLKTSTTYQGITLKENGIAKMDSQGKWKKKALSIVNSITTDKMTKAQKLQACWNYMISSSRFRYVSKYPDISTANWHKKTAYNMFTTHNGNCYSFACGFSALAEEVGYEPYIICGRVSGSRDHASDGLTRHAWVMINGCYYDPEAQFAGWYKGVYGNSEYGVRHEVVKKVKYTDTNGKVLTSKKKTKEKNSNKYGLVKENGNYYYYLYGKKLTKRWLLINGKKYYFKKNGVAAIGSNKISGKYYIFNTKGQLLVGKQTKVVKVKNSYYRVNSTGQAVKGWDKKKKYYYFVNGKRATDIQYMNDKFYFFSSKGVYNLEKTKLLQNAAVYEKDITDLYALLGEPKKKEYYDSCYGPGQDGMWTYKNFKVFTYKDLEGNEIFLGAE